MEHWQKWVKKFITQSTILYESDRIPRYGRINGRYGKYA